MSSGSFLMESFLMGGTGFTRGITELCINHATAAVDS
jgi:hypothetical protein